jgi:hypothetical protein
MMATFALVGETTWVLARVTYIIRSAIISIRPLAGSVIVVSGNVTFPDMIKEWARDFLERTSAMASLYTQAVQVFLLHGLHIFLLYADCPQCMAV